MFTPLLRRFVPATLAALPVLGLAAVYTMSTQQMAVASSEYRLFFAEHDLDGDGIVTVAERTEALAVELAEDPFVVPEACLGSFIEEEASRPVEEIAAEEVAYFDSDADGAVTYEEVAALLTRERAEDFLDYDEDGNGFVTVDELVWEPSAEEVPEEELAEIAEEEGLSVACLVALDAEDVPDEGVDAAEARVILAEFDTDRDGRVTLMEFLEN